MLWMIWHGITLEWIDRICTSIKFHFCICLNWKLLYTGQNLLTIYIIFFKDATNLKLWPESPWQIRHCVHRCINPLPKKHHPPSFLLSPPLNLQTVQAPPLFRQSPSSISVFCECFCECHLLWMFYTE